MPPPPENFSGGHFRPRPKSLPITGSIQPSYPLALTRAAATRTTTTAATTVTPPPSQPRTTKGAAKGCLFMVSIERFAFAMSSTAKGGGVGLVVRTKGASSCGWLQRRGLCFVQGVPPGGGHRIGGNIFLFIIARVFFIGGKLRWVHFYYALNNVAIHYKSTSRQEL
ncbi:hypothetical protein Tco_0240893 [Tanacetum coccineum]